ncbi:thioesterase II family protein [Nocardia brasiliensis]|uniref:thioesterase II family protein n=1 Tax=Nocardia brasiliensis TaxID=37326 RepID=UPI00366F41AA
MAEEPDSASLWIRRFHPSLDAESRLVCLPHAGGSASFFLPVSQALAPHCEVLAVQYPGRQDRRTEKCIENVPELADAVTEQLLTWTDRPLALFGHSLGAILAFEVAGRLEDKGVALTALFASGRRAPSRHRHETVHTLNDDGLIAELKALNGTNHKLLADDEILRMALPAIRSDYTAVETYRYIEGTAPLRTPIQAHIGLDDPKVTSDEARDWARHTHGGFSLRTYPGGHFYLASQAEPLIEAIREVVFNKDHRITEVPNAIAVPRPLVRE